MLVGSIYSLTANKLLQNIFQRNWVLFDIINNILKVLQNHTPGKLLCSKWRPRWPPYHVESDGYKSFKIHYTKGFSADLGSI